MKFFLWAVASTQFAKGVAVELNPKDYFNIKESVFAIKSQVAFQTEVNRESHKRNC